MVARRSRLFSVCDQGATGSQTCLHCGSHQVSAALRSELRPLSYKNCRLCYITRDLIVEQREKVLNIAEPVSEDDVVSAPDVITTGYPLRLRTGTQAVRDQMTCQSGFT